MPKVNLSWWKDLCQISESHCQVNCIATCKELCLKQSWHSKPIPLHSSSRRDFCEDSFEGSVKILWRFCGGSVEVLWSNYLWRFCDVCCAGSVNILWRLCEDSVKVLWKFCWRLCHDSVKILWKFYEGSPRLCESSARFCEDSVEALCGFSQGSVKVLWTFSGAVWESWKVLWRLWSKIC